MLLRRLEDAGLIRPPTFLSANTHYLTIMGSHAYGVADTRVRETPADLDVYGFCIPPKEWVFPHLRGEVAGFGTPGPRFEQFQKHGIHEPEPSGGGGPGRVWDLTIFGIVKYFELCRENNPNVLESLFTPRECVLHETSAARLARDRRGLFLSKLAWKKFRGYAWSQMHKMESKEPIGGRRAIVERFGYDVKFAYHVVRLLDEAEQILTRGDIDLQNAREALKAIRRGDWRVEDVRAWAMEKEKSLEAAYAGCKLPEVPPERELRELLLNCLEEHYGRLPSEAVARPDRASLALREIDEALRSAKRDLGWE